MKIKGVTTLYSCLIKITIFIASQEYCKVDLNKSEIIRLVEQILSYLIFIGIVLSLSSIKMNYQKSLTFSISFRHRYAYLLLTNLTFCLGILLSSCNSLEDKPITEPLSLEERQQLVEKDIDYMFVFGVIDVMEKYRSPITSSEKKSMSELSYRRLKEFMSKWTLGDDVDAKKAEYEKEWKSMYESYCVKVDSINDYWLEYIQAYKPENYLKIELVEIIDKTDVFLGYVKVRLRLIPLKGSISDVEAYFGLDGMMGRNPIKVSESFSSPITMESWMSFNQAFNIDASKVNDLPIGELIKIYPLKTNITELSCDGKAIEYTDGYFKIPSCIRDMWSVAPAKGKEWDKEYEKESNYLRVIKDLIDANMPSEYDYVNDRTKKQAYDYDKLAATFYYEIAGQN